MDFKVQTRHNSVAWGSWRYTFGGTRRDDGPVFVGFEYKPKPKVTALLTYTLQWQASRSKNSLLAELLREAARAEREAEEKAKEADRRVKEAEKLYEEKVEARNLAARLAKAKLEESARVRRGLLRIACLFKMEGVRMRRAETQAAARISNLHKQVKDMGVYATSLHGKMLEVANYYKELVNEYRKNLKAEAENVIKGLQECMEKLSLKVETLTNQNLLLQKERDEAKADAAAALAAMQQAQADCDASTNQAEVKKLRAEIKALTIENEERTKSERSAFKAYYVLRDERDGLKEELEGYKSARGPTRQQQRQQQQQAAQAGGGNNANARDSEEHFDMADRQDLVVESEPGKTRRAGSHRHRASKGGQQQAAAAGGRRGGGGRS